MPAALLIEWGDEKHTASQWTKRHPVKGVTGKIITRRMRNGWPAGEAISKPIQPTGGQTFKLIQYNTSLGKKDINQLKEITGHDEATLRARAKKGLDLLDKSDMRKTRPQTKDNDDTMRLGKWGKPVHVISPEEYYISNLRASGLTEPEIAQRLNGSI